MEPLTVFYPSLIPFDKFNILLLMHNTKDGVGPNVSLVLAITLDMQALSRPIKTNNRTNGCSNPTKTLALLQT
jgi:hypothetical protein